jgi:endonuclease/exonuclease/phosphatase family metal-dependent hydrolase
VPDAEVLVLDVLVQATSNDDVTLDQAREATGHAIRHPFDCITTEQASSHVRSRDSLREVERGHAVRSTLVVKRNLLEAKLSRRRPHTLAGFRVHLDPVGDRHRASDDGSERAMERVDEVD